jgi:transposase
MRPYPLAKRLAVLKACDSGKGTREVAREFKCSECWVRRVKQRRQEPWRALRFLHRLRRPARWIGYAGQIETAMENYPCLTLRELKEHLGTELSVQTLSRALKELGLSKNRPRGWRDQYEPEYGARSG